MLVGTAPMAIVANVAKPYRTFGDVIRAAKAKPEAIASARGQRQPRPSRHDPAAGSGRVQGHARSYKAAGR